MRREGLNELSVFVAVADAKSFTKAAARLNMSPSALSHALRALEARLDVRLLSRTTRSVAPTAAGERLLATLRPAFADIDASLANLGVLRNTPSGTVRITTFRQAADAVIWPMLPAFLASHPDVVVEMTIDDALIDIVAERYDLGIRLGEMVEIDMVAVRVGPEVRSAIVASPSYLKSSPAPLAPRDLTAHRCIGYRNSRTGGLFPWEFEKDGRTLQIKVAGPLVLNDIRDLIAAALAGVGLAYVFEADVADHLGSGRLIRVLPEWGWSGPGYQFYYPSRRNMPSALTAFVKALRGAGGFETAESRVASRNTCR